MMTIMNGVSSICSRASITRQLRITNLIKPLSTITSSNFSTSNSSTKPTSKPKVKWLDLNGLGLSAVERLCLEEALLRHDPLNRSWAIVGTHDPIYNTRLKKLKYKTNISTASGNSIRDPYYENCIIIMGIGGKPENLLNIPKVKKDNIVVIKRFSGGGTVVIDHSSLWTTFIGRTVDFPHVQPYPKDIMSWSANEIFDNVFTSFGNSTSGGSGDSGGMSNGGMSNGVKRKSLMVDSKSCGISSTYGLKEIPTSSSTSKSTTTSNQQIPQMPKFHLRENDYVLGSHKMGGNAQSITKGSWLHHTSFLWDYDVNHMEYLSLPDKRPTYRGDRHHDDFLIKLKSVYGSGGSVGSGSNVSDAEGKKLFFQHVKNSSSDAFDLEEASFSDALEVINNELGGFQNWFDGKCRTRILDI